MALRSLTWMSFCRGTILAFATLSLQANIQNMFLNNVRSIPLTAHQTLPCSRCVMEVLVSVVYTIHVNNTPLEISVSTMIPMLTSMSTRKRIEPSLLIEEKKSEKQNLKRKPRKRVTFGKQCLRLMMRIEAKLYPSQAE